MDDSVMVPIPVSPEAAATLRTEENRQRIGRLVSDLLRPSPDAEDPLASLIAELKAEARQAGLTDAEIEAELAAYNAEHRY